MSDDVGAAPTLEVGPSGRARTVSMMVAVVGLPGGALLTLGLLGTGAPPWASIAMITGQALLTVAPWARMLLRTTVTAGPDGITVVGPRPARGSWAWSEILEVCFARQGAWAIGVRVRGSVWHAPGPQAPAVAMVTFPDRASRDAARQVLADLCRRHGVVFTETRQGFGSAPPGSRLRDDVSEA